MSGTTQTTNEVLFSFFGAATTTTIATGAQSLIAGYPPMIIQGGYFSNLGVHTSTMRLKLGAFITATATVPTFTFGLQLTTTSTFGTTITPGTTAAVTPVAGTNLMMFWDIEIGIRTIVQTAGSTLVTMGEIRSGVGLATPFTTSMPATNAAATVTNFDIEQQYYLWPSLTLGTATAGNTMTTQYCKLYGEN